MAAGDAVAYRLFVLLFRLVGSPNDVPRSRTVRDASVDVCVLPMLYVLGAGSHGLDSGA